MKANFVFDSGIVEFGSDMLTIFLLKYVMIFLWKKLSFDEIILLLDYYICKSISQNASNFYKGQ